MTSFEETRASLAGREGEVLAALGITPPRRGHIRCPLPSHIILTGRRLESTLRSGWGRA
jgi:hypothetical protein